MARQLTAEQWAALLPIRPDEELQFLSVTAQALQEMRLASVASLILLPMSWPGVHNLADEHVAGKVAFHAGRWFVDDEGITCMRTAYQIDHERVKETDWLAHMLEKSWFYDPTDFLDALEYARREITGVSEKRLDFLLWEEARTALENAELPFYPSRMLGQQRVYLTSRMDEETHMAFCRFLADQGVYVE